MFSIGMQNSTAKNNYVHDMGSCISFNRESNHNSVYNNTLSNCKTGIDLSNTGNNSIHNNKITDSQSGIVFYNISNKIHDNEISQGKNGLIFKLVRNSNQSSDIASITSPVPVVNDYESYLADLVDANDIFNVENPYVHKEREMDTSVKVDLATNDTSITRLSVSP
jgi:parallel beta-helix repeat protein